VEDGYRLGRSMDRDWDSETVDGFPVWQKVFCIRSLGIIDLEGNSSQIFGSK
jgi:hypothetical protein